MLGTGKLMMLSADFGPLLANRLPIMSINAPGTSFVSDCGICPGGDPEAERFTERVPPVKVETRVLHNKSICQAPAEIAAKPE